MITRGIRNNNPGNLRHSPVTWAGLCKDQTDTEFCQFQTPLDGLVALARLLVVYERKYNLDTADDIINRYAPSFENPTRAYQKHVAQCAGVDEAQPLNLLTNTDHFVGALKGIISEENGDQPYSDQLIKQAIQIASSH